MGTGFFRRFHNFFPGSPRFSICNVVIYRTGKQVNILLYDTDILSNTLHRIVFHIHPINGNPAAGHIIKSGNQIAHGCFAAAGRSHQRHLFSGMNRKIQMFKYRIVIIHIFKGSIFETDFPLRIHHFPGPIVIKNINIRIHNLQETFYAGHTPLELLCKFHNPAYGCNQGADIHHVSNQISRLHLFQNQKKAACKYHGQIHQTIKNTDRSLENRHILIRFGLDSQKFYIIILKLILFNGFIGKCFHYFLSQQTIFNSGVQFTDLITLSAECSTLPLVDGNAAAQHNRNHNKYDQRQRKIDGSQNKKCTCRLDCSNKKLLRTMVCKFRDIKQVIGNPAHDLAYFCIIIISIRQLHQMCIGIPTHIGLHFRTHDVSHIRHIVTGGTLHDFQ